MRDFELEAYFTRWEFAARYHLTASDAQSMTLAELLAMADTDRRERFERLWLGYTETRGDPELREAIAITYDGLEAEHIQCFAGAEEGVYAAMRVLLKPGDHAVVVVPNYQAAETLPLEICEVSGVELDAEDGWRLDPDEIRAALRPNTRLLSINFPNNPTGHLPSRAVFDEIIAICRDRDLYLFSDEVYRLLELDESKRLPQVAECYERGFSLNVMSKAYGLPGLRIGWIASRDTAMLDRFNRYKHYLSICNPAPSEQLALIALRARERILARNRDILRANLADLDRFFDDHAELFDWARPDGGCVAYPRFRGRGGVENFCRRLVEEAGVLLLPSSIYRSELMVAPADRFRIGCGRAGQREGLDVMREFIHDHRGDFDPAAG